jgi:predicted TIM-barrel fold metal-dependent hydrolase
VIYDADAWVGHWPFQSYPQTSVAALLREMDKRKIAKALVGNLHGLFYKDAHEANHELSREIGQRRDRLIPCATMNPRYYGWQQDLKQCREEFGMPVIRLTPDYHGYRLSDACAESLANEAHQLKMRVALCWRIVDPRGRHPLDPGREATHGEALAFVKKFPRAAFLMLNFGSVPGGRLLRRPACYFDITLFLGRNGLRLQEEFDKHGTDRFVVGTTLLLRYGTPPLLALEKCRLTRAQREAVQWRNLARLVPEME